MTVTMKEVAKLAGVGLGTVSRVLNGGSASESAKRKVESAMKELNYQPNYYAKGLKTNRTYTVALILPTIWHPFFSEFAFHVENALEGKHYKMYLCNSQNDIIKEKDYIQLVAQNKVDGIIGITYSDIDEFVSSNLPFVSIDRYFTEDVIYVTADNEAGGRIAVNELIKRGAKNLSFIGGYQMIPNETKNRRKYFELECQEKGISYTILDMLEPLHDLSDYLETFLLENPQIDGIFTINDSMATEVYKTLIKLGKKVPEDVQLIGFDGQRYRESEPFLVSTIVQPIKEMAETAVDLITDVIKGEEVEKRTILPVTFGESWTTRKEKIEKNS